MTERWRPVKNYEGHYEVSDHGNVRSLGCVFPNRLTGGVTRRRGKVLKRLATPKGYLVVNLSVNRRVNPRRIHQLVLEAFVGPRPDGMQACHTNSNNQDNRVENLRWDTPENNVKDRIATGRYSSSIKLIGCSIERARDLRANGCNLDQIGRWLGVSGSHVCKVMS